MTERLLVFIALTLFALTAHAQSEPEDVAREAFYAQMNGDYDRLSTFYHSSITSFFSMISHELIESTDSDPTSNSMLESIFQTTDPEEIRALGEQKIFARMFEHIFLSKLTPEEQELMKQAQFEYLGTTHMDDGMAQVQYVVAFTSEVKTNKKTMLLKKNGDEWLITMRPEILDVLREAINPTQ